MELQFITQNKDGNYYFVYKTNVKRGIRGKTKGNVDELLIVGIPKDKAKEFAKKEGVEIK